ncbi:MAG: hypothetical protein RL699_350 [Bacteroidota bacterium]|jgi:uncharacterized repeat protein (TIGR03806 family)
MNTTWTKGFLYGIVALLLGSCANDAPYVPVEESPVVVNLAEVPYPNLSMYKFFTGPMKDLKPAVGLLLYKPASELFTDYAKKSRYVWMPKNTKATYVSDYEVLELPVGAVLIKNFFYNKVAPSNTTRIIETRLMIRKETGWIFAEYVWNDEQTDAILQMTGSTTPITWTDENNVTRSITYKIPKESECLLCHGVSLVPHPIGIKPQNLNYNLAYTTGTTNQLSKWVSAGYLENNLPDNSSITSTIDYTNLNQSLNLRVRSYFDINCAHCHRDGGTADFPGLRLRFEFNQTTSISNMGACMSPYHFMPGYTGQLVIPGNASGSGLYGRLSTNDPNFRMPFVGRSILHQEAIDLVGQWINSLQGCE